MLAMITFISNKHFGLVYIAQRRLEWNTTVGRGWEALSTVISTIHGTSFSGLSTSFPGKAVGSPKRSRSKNFVCMLRNLTYE
jgi:hypothetical protein